MILKRREPCSRHFAANAAGAIEGYEIRYVFQNEEFRRDGLIIRAPNADLGRDPHWGRTEECYGEDAFFNSTLSANGSSNLE
ncbi:MAG: hypothetical protein OEW48_14875 [Phycisphaerae bacterium]|nr:hypothetical protein [Phycisphaerae bacterium]